MNEIKHTPGPWGIWELAPDHETDPLGLIIISGPEGENEICGVVGNESDAHLISAAPDLLAAAEKVLADLTARIATAPGNKVPLFDGIGELHDAINKAKGE